MLSPTSHGDSTVYEIIPGTLLHLLAHTVVLNYTAPYLPPSALLSLAATSRAYRALVYGNPSVFRHLDLSAIKLADFQLADVERGRETWHNVQLDEVLTEDEFYSGPLRGIFSSLGRAGWLANVHTLILDRVAVTAELVHEILTSPAYNVRILSLRGARHLNEQQLRRALQAACRPTRPAGTPRLRGLYIFGDGSESNNSDDVCKTGHAGDIWYRNGGRVLAKTGNSNSSIARAFATEWANTLMDCRGIIAFDGVLCNGPRHVNSPVFGKFPVSSNNQDSGNGNNGSSGSNSSGSGSNSNTASNVAPAPPFALAAYSLGGCASCGNAPEGWTTWGDENVLSTTPSAGADPAAGSYVSRYPLLWPPPRLTSSLRAAMCPAGERVHPLRPGLSDSGCSNGHVEAHEPPRFIARCEGCLTERMCFSCGRWWCESCMPNTSLSHTMAIPAANRNDMALLGSLFQPLPTISYSCRECGPSCNDCITKTQLRCKRCRSIYCIVHNVGSSKTHCDWCCAPTYRYVQQPRVSVKSHY